MYEGSMKLQELAVIQGQLTVAVIKQKSQDIKSQDTLPNLRNFQTFLLIVIPHYFGRINLGSD